MKKLKCKTLFYYIRKNFLTLFLLFVATFINSASIFYYLYCFNNITLIFSLFLAFLVLGIFIYFNIFQEGQQAEFKESPQFKLREELGIRKDRWSKFITLKTWQRANRTSWILSFLFLGIIFYLFWLLYTSGTMTAIYSPWSLLPSSFWLCLALALILLFFIIYLESPLSYFLLVVLYLLFFSIAFFVYKIAFGYDQLLHQRAMTDIYNFGLIKPKTLYYIGHYVWTLSLFKFWPGSLSFLDRALVPFLSAILIPSSIYFNFKKRGRQNNSWALLLFLLLPFSIFTYTVSQNLAFLFLLILILFSFNKKFISQKSNFFFLFSLALSITFIHPLAGVPALIFVSILFSNVLNLKPKLARFLRSLAYVAQFITLPLLLCVVGGRFSFFKISFSSWVPKLLGQENIFLNFVYLFFANKNILLILVFLLLSIFVFKKGRKELRIFYFNSLALLLSYIATLFIDFPFLSQVDKGSYANRILILSFLFLVPVFYDIFICLLKKINQEKKLIQIIFAVFLIPLLLTSLYLNYPRKDNYFNSRSFSVSENDFLAVHLIEAQKENDNYLVLANQQVGAAAIRDLGFKRYYGPWFYYSVQTAGLPYNYYLKMMEHPEKGLMKDLMSQLGASGIYLVLNDYWWAFDRIAEELRVQADAIYNISDGAVMIFYFKP